MSTKASWNEIKKYAKSVFDEHLDDLGDVNLTEVEEDVQDHFDISDKDFEECEYSFRIYALAVEEGLA